MKRKGIVIITAVALLVFATAGVFAAEQDKRCENMPTEHRHMAQQPDNCPQDKEAAKSADNKDGQQPGLHCMKDGGMHSAAGRMTGHGHHQPVNPNAQTKDGQKAGMGCMDGMHSAMKDKIAGDAKADAAAGQSHCGAKPQEKQ